MIYIERKIIIKNNEATIEEPVVLYKGDRNIELQFTIENNPFKYKPGMDITYGQLIIKRPSTTPIFSEPAKMSSSRVLFTVTGDMIDELVELGDYDFQIRLLNTDQSSRGSLPPVTAGITIKEPLYEEAVVNTASVNSERAVVMPANDGIMLLADDGSDGLFDADGNYSRTNWYGGDIITDSKLNKIEEALYQINDDIPTDYATQEYVDDSIISTRNYVEDNYATISYMDNELQRAEMRLETYTDNAIGRINLDNYATTSYVDDQRRATEAYAEVYTTNAINKLDLSSYAKESFVTDSINSNNNYIETVILKDYVTDQELEDAINGIEGGGGNVDLTGYATEQYVNEYVANNKPNLEGFATEQYVIDYTGDALGKYATKSYVDKAVANIEGGGTGSGLNIMTIGNGIDEYIFTGNEFTYEEYTSYAGKSVLLDNVTINFADAEAGGKQRTITYKNELVYVNFNGDKLFTIASSLSERECERSQYSIGKDGTITRTYYTQYVTKEYIEESNFATNDYVTQYVGEALGKYAKQSYVNEMLGDIESLLGGI